MVHLFYSQFTQPFSAKTLAQYQTSISFDVENFQSRYPRWQERQAHLIGRLLLRKGLSTYGISELPSLQYSDHQRPYFDLPMDFSISHSGEYVLCVLADNMRIGADIERIRPIALEDMQPSFKPQEWQVIIQSGDPNRQFFNYWTRKEAVAKADGRGLDILDKIALTATGANVEDHPWFTTHLKLAEGYCVCLAGSTPEVHQCQITLAEW